MRQRRSVRMFSDRPVSREAIEWCIRAAGTAPSPMGFLRETLDRPEHERAFVLIPVGYPTGDGVVPKIRRKGLEEISAWV